VPRENLVGRTIAGYTVDREVGEGGTSAVYDAHHGEYGRVALKVLRERLRQDPTAVARFIREAKFGARVEHSNVVHTIETGEAEGGIPFLAIEWAPGELLEKYVKTRGRLDPAEASIITLQIAAAVDAAHCQNIVHRDLKPDNVMYDPETRTVKLLDFGIATDTTTPADERLTRAGFFVGTLMYVAPEALSGELVTPAADQYSLATIAYFLLTGCHPYTAKQPREMFTQLLTMPPIPISQAKENLHFRSEVEEVIMRGLARQPKDRYPSVMEFAVELERTLALPAEEKGRLSRLLRRFSRQPDRKR
jgi:eukaryotic-like serine/threonine-protein kinase